MTCDTRHGAKWAQQWIADETTIVGWDLSNGVETVVKGFYQSGVLHITDAYEIIDDTCTGSKEPSENKSFPLSSPPRSHH